MSRKYFRVELTVEPKRGGGAELAPPQSLQGADFRYWIAKDGGEEAIIDAALEGDALTRVLGDSACGELTLEQARTLAASYPAAKLKQKLRAREGQEPESYTVQLVRSGFFIVEVPVSPSK